MLKLGLLIIRFVNFVIMLIGNGNWTEWSTIQGVIGRVISNQQSMYQLIVSITKCENVQIHELLLLYLYSEQHEYILSGLQTAEKQLLKEPNSVQMIDVCIPKLSDYYPAKSSNWTAVNGYLCDRATIT